MEPGQPKFPHRNLPLLLLRAREGVLARFRPVLKAHGITEQQWRVVRVLRERGVLEPRQIGESCQLSSPSLTGVLARMDGLGLVARKRVDHDQRRVLVSLTAKSRAMADRMAPGIERIYGELEAELGAELIGQCYRTLDQLLGSLRGSDPPVEG